MHSGREVDPVEDPRTRGVSRSRRLTRIALVAALTALLSGPAPAVDAPADETEESTPELRLSGMTFVGSRGDIRELVLRSRTAYFDPQARTARLEGVEAEVSEGEGGRSFSISCQRAEFDLESQDFVAEGEVEGITGDGQRYSAPWVRYRHEEGVLFTDAPVVMSDDTGRFRGDGFRYEVAERRFRLIGNVRVEQGL